MSLFDFLKYMKEFFPNERGLCKHLNIGTGNGFSFSEDTINYNVTVNPKTKFFAKIAFKHELGHVIFDDLFEKMEDSHIDYCLNLAQHKWFGMFARLEKIFYWNKLIRWIKIKLGYSIKLAYNRNDVAYSRSGTYMTSKQYTREQNELFADWYALGGFDEFISANKELK